MKAMIFAAGLGTRLKPFTNDRPKALVEIDGKTLLQKTIERLKNFGINEIIINAHHFPELIIAFLKEKNYFDIRIEISVESELLDTGGGLKRAAWFFNDNRPFLVHNTDVLTNLNYQRLFDAFMKRETLAVLAVRRRDTNRYFLFDNEMRLSGWQNKATDDKITVKNDSGSLRPLSFMGIQVLSPEIFAHFPKGDMFSVVDAYLKIIAKNLPIYGLDCGDSDWLDVGKPETLRQAKKFKFS